MQTSRKHTYKRKYEILMIVDSSFEIYLYTLQYKYTQDWCNKNNFRQFKQKQKKQPDSVYEMMFYCKLYKIR